MTADLFVGEKCEEWPERAWNHIYRSLDHTKVAGKCKLDKMKRFPPEFVDFGDFFLSAQYKRERSDYEFEYSPVLGEVESDIERAKIKVRSLLAADEKHKRAFAVFVLIEKHRHEEEPKKRPGAEH